MFQLFSNAFRIPLLGTIAVANFGSCPSLLGMCALMRNPIDSCLMGGNNQSDAYQLALRRCSAVSGPAELQGMFPPQDTTVNHQFPHENNHEIGVLISLETLISTKNIYLDFGSSVFIQHFICCFNVFITMLIDFVG